MKIVKAHENMVMIDRAKEGSLKSKHYKALMKVALKAFDDDDMERTHPTTGKGFLDTREYLNKQYVRDNYNYAWMNHEAAKEDRQDLMQWQASAR